MKEFLSFMQLIVGKVRKQIIFFILDFDISPELLRMLKQNEFTTNQTINKSNKGSSVKIGDTIFFKYALENTGMKHKIRKILKNSKLN